MIEFGVFPRKLIYIVGVLIAATVSRYLYVDVIRSRF